MFGGGRYKKMKKECTDKEDSLRGIDIATKRWWKLTHKQREIFTRFWYGDIQFYVQVRKLLDHGTLDEIILSDDTIVGCKTWFRLKY